MRNFSLVCAAGFIMAGITLLLHGAYVTSGPGQSCYTHGYHEAITQSLFDHTVICIKYTDAGLLRTPLHTLEQNTRQ